MPYLTIKTNCNLDGVDTDAFIRQASNICSEALGKPEDYMMVSFDAFQRMIFGGKDSPTAFVELRALDLPKESLPILSAIICNLLSEKLGIKPNRIYINFRDFERTHWGWDGKTFG